MSPAEAAPEDTRASGGGRGGGKRRLARLAAVQALYQLELNPGRGADAVIAEFVRHRLGRESDDDNLGEADPVLFGDIVRGVADDRERLDETISSVLPEDWPLPRLETILRAILQAGAYELVHRSDVPPRVTISEYVGIAHAFFTGKEPGMANGVLDRLGRTQRASEM